AEVHAREEDEGSGRVQREGHRQQQRHRHGRPHAGQDTDGGTEQTADDDPQEVHRRQGPGEALEEEGELVHQKPPPRMPDGRLRPSPVSKTRSTTELRKSATRTSKAGRREPKPCAVHQKTSAPARIQPRWGRRSAKARKPPTTQASAVKS